MASKKLGFGVGLAAGSVLLVGITIFVNQTVANLDLGRFDMTEEKIYTISDGAKNILGSLDVPVQVSYYVKPADEMPSGSMTTVRPSSGSSSILLK